MEWERWAGSIMLNSNPLGVDQASPGLGDGFTVEIEGGISAAHGGHGIADQQQFSPGFHALGQANARWVHMVAAARHLATIYPMLPQEIYPQAARLLDL